MKISLIPWEVIWLINLVVIVVWIFAINMELPKRRDRRKRYWFLLPEQPIFYGLFAVIFMLPLTLNLLHIQFDVDAINDAATTFDNPIVDLRPHRYDIPPQTLYDAALKVVQSSRTYGQPWIISFAEYMPDEELGRITAEVSVFNFVDDVSITIQPVGGQTTDYRVDVYSTSRVGEADFGENGRHIVQFFRALDKELATQQ